MNIYLDCGGKDIDMIFLPETVDAYGRLLKTGYIERKNLSCQIDNNAGHNESQWTRKTPLFFNVYVW